MKTANFLFFLLLLYSIFLNTSFVFGAVHPLNLTFATDKPACLLFEGELGTYTVLCSAKWTNQYAIRKVTLEIKSTEPEPPPVLLTLIATVVASSLIISALIFYGLVTFQKKAKATSTLPVQRRMKVKNGRLYLLDAPDETWVFGSVDDAMEASKTLVSKKELNPEDVNIFEVNIAFARDKWFSRIEKASKEAPKN